MGWRASSSLLLTGCWLVVPAQAEERPARVTVPTTPFAERTPQPAPFRVASVAVAAFPDVVPERPKPLPDPALELLSTNPYESVLQAHKIAMNLYGSDPAFEDPYADDRRLANPYTEDLTLANPYSSAEGIDNPYSSALLLQEDPYASPRR